MASGEQDSLSLWRAALWSLAIAAALLIPYYALQIHEYLGAAPGQGVNPLDSEVTNETLEQRLETVLRIVMVVMPVMIVVVALVLFISVLAPIFLLGRIVRRYLLLPLPPPGGRRARSP